jgi:predicted Zn-dependent peptidase
MQNAIARLLLLGAATAMVAEGAAAQRPARQSPPPLGAPKAFKLPPKRELTLPNGMQVTLVPFGKIPKVTVHTAVRTGHIDEAPTAVWLADVTGAMMTEGTTTRSGRELASQVAGMGGSLAVYVGDDLTQVGGTVLAEHGPAMVRLVADLLRNPSFPEAQLPRIVATKAREVAIAKSQPTTIAQEQFLGALYGGHPYGRPLPTEAMLKSYDIAQVRDFYARNVGAARSHLYVVGVYDAAAIERAVRESFADWPAGPLPTVLPPAPRSAHAVTLIDRPDAVQSTIMLGIPTPGPTAKDYTALQVTDAILGGTFGSRITSNIREQKGYTYSPQSYFGTHRHDAYWAEQADVTTKFTGASLQEIFGEIDRLRKEPPPVAELDGIKNNMIGLFTLRNGSRGGIVNQLVDVDLQGMGDDYLTGYVSRVMRVTPADVQRTTETYLKPDRMTLVVVGDKKTVAEQVAPFQRPVP